RDASLPPIDGEEVGADPVVERRAEPSRVVTLARHLDLHDVGAEIGEAHRRVRSRKDAAEVEDPDARERRRHFIRARTSRNKRGPRIAKMMALANATSASSGPPMCNGSTCTIRSR